MTGFTPGRLAIWSRIRQSRLYRSTIYVFLPAFIFLQVSMNVTEIRTFHASYFDSITGGNSVLSTNKSMKNVLELGKRKSSEKKPFRLTVCAMVHNEVPYLIEWIEFHRLQGADHFVLYNYYSTDSMEYLPMLYESHRPNLTIHIFPARFYGTDRNDGNLAQTSEYTMVDCYVRYRQHSQWLLLASTAGHFVFSPTYHSVWKYLEKKADTIGAMRIPAFRFGTSGLEKKFRTWLGPDSYTGTVDLLYEPVNDTDLYPLVLEMNKFRAPHPDLDGAGDSARNCRKNEENSTAPCIESSHLTLISGNRYCTKSNISECLYPQTDTTISDFSILRADNHEWRSTEHAQSLMKLGLLNPSRYQFLDKPWYSRIQDTLKLDKYGQEVRKNIMKLKPKVFLDVGRECDTRALDSGQQVKCPADHPYPFGNDGLRRLMKCCKYDLDNGRKQLTEQSGNCWNNSFVECKDPVGKGKWLHRSCCTPPRSVMAVLADEHEYRK